MVLTYQETAELFNSDRVTVRGLVKAYDLEPKPVPRTSKGRGLDLNDLKVLAKALNRPAPTEIDMRRVASFV